MPAPKSPALKIGKVASISNQAIQDRRIRDTSAGPSTQRTALSESTVGGKLSKPAVQPGSPKALTGASGLAASFLNLSLINARYTLGEIRHASLKSLVPENAYMSSENAIAHWKGTLAVGSKKGMSAHRYGFENVLSKKGRPVATDPESYASFAREMALKPLNSENGKRVMEYTYRNDGDIRIAKYDEQTNLFVRVDMKSAIITLYRMFPAEKKRKGLLSPILEPSKEGLKLFLFTHQPETQVKTRGVAP